MDISVTITSEQQTILKEAGYDSEEDMRSDLKSMEAQLSNAKGLRKTRLQENIPLLQEFLVRYENVSRVNSSQQAILVEAGFTSLSEIEVELKAQQDNLPMLTGLRHTACLRAIADLKDLQAQYEQVKHMHTEVISRFDY